RADVVATQAHGPAELSQRLRPDAASARSRTAAPMEEAAAHFRQLDERSVSQGRAGELHPAGLRDHAASVVASLSDFDEALGSARGLEPRDRLAEECLDG